MKFPLYRKYSNNKSFFKVLDNEGFEEIQCIGNQFTIHLFKAKILPDRYLVHDLIHMKNDHWIAIDQKEYDIVKRKWQKRAIRKGMQ